LAVFFLTSKSWLLLQILALYSSLLKALFIFLALAKKELFILAQCNMYLLKKRGAGRGPFRGGAASPFCVGVKRANLCTSTQLSLTEISTFCINN
jgi:hypothetical protein